MHLTDVGVTVLNHELLYDLFAGDISTRLRSFQSENTNKYFQTKQITMRSQPNYFNVVVVVAVVNYGVLIFAAVQIRFSCGQ